MKYFPHVLLAAILLAIASFAVARAAEAPKSKGTETTAAATPVVPATKTLPIELSGKDVDDMVTYLNSQPYSVVNPIVNFLAAKEQAAVAAATAKPEAKK